MSFGDWYLALFCLGAGVGIPSFWLTPRGRALMREPGREIRFHVAAEVATGLALVIAGVGVASEAGWAKTVTAFGLGMLVYTLIASPGRYLDRRDRRTIMLLAATIVGAMPGLVFLFIEATPKT